MNKNMRGEKDTFNKIVNGAKTVKLTEKERANLFVRVDSYVKKNPIQISKINSRNDFNWFSYIFTNYNRAVSFALVVFIVLGGSTSLAAQKTLPGNILYPVKVNINEEIRSLFVSTANRVNFEADRAMTRLKEAEVLAKRGELSPEAQVQLEGYFDAHLAKVENDIQKYKENGDLKKALDASTKLESSLKIGEENLAVLIGVDGEQTDEQLSKIVTELQTNIVSSSIARAEVEQAIVSTSEDNEEVRLIAENKLSDVKKLIGDLVGQKAAQANEVGATSARLMSAKIESAATATITNHVDTSFSVDSTDQEISIWLEQSNTLTAEGEEKIKQGLYKEAHALLKKAYEVAEEAKILKDLNDSSEAHIDDLE